MAHTYAVTVEIASAATDVDLTTEPTLLYGYSLRNTGGAATTVYLRDGTGDNTGDVVVVVEMGAAGATDAEKTVSLATPVRLAGGVRLERDGTSSVEGAIWVEDD